MPLLNRAVEMSAEITAWRHELHRHPELLYDTPWTSAFITAKLESFGCDEVVTGIGRSGVVGLIRGRQGNGPVLGLRADFDALPIHEETGLPHASLSPGKMHACGHDGHTAMLLGAARHLCETRNFAGAVAVIFQPAEEGGAGGDAMVKDGMMERFNIARVFAMHNARESPSGISPAAAGRCSPRSTRSPSPSKVWARMRRHRIADSIPFMPARRSSARCSRSCRAPPIRWSRWSSR